VQNKVFFDAVTKNYNRSSLMNGVTQRQINSIESEDKLPTGYESDVPGTYEKLLQDDMISSSPTENDVSMEPTQQIGVFNPPQGEYDFDSKPFKKQLVGIELNPGPFGPQSQNRPSVLKMEKKILKNRVKKVKKNVAKKAKKIIKREIPRSMTAPNSNNRSGLMTSQGPAAVGFGIQQNAKGFGDNIRNRIIRQELYGDFYGSVAFNVRQIYLNPGLVSTYRYGSRIAKLYDFYRIKNLRFFVVETGGTQITGTVSMFYDYDCTDAPPRDEQEMLQNFKSRMTDAWHALSVDYDPSAVKDKSKLNRFLVRRESDAVGATLSANPLTDTDPAVLYIATSGFVSDTVLNGKIFMEYEIDFFNPHVKDDELINVTWGTGNDGSTTFGPTQAQNCFSGNGTSMVLFTPFAAGPGRLTFGPVATGNDWRLPFSGMATRTIGGVSMSPTYVNQFKGNCTSALNSNQIALYRDGVYRVTWMYRDGGGGGDYVNSNMTFTPSLAASLAGAMYADGGATVTIPSSTATFVVTNTAAGGSANIAVYTFKVVGATSQVPGVVTFSCTTNSATARTSCQMVWELVQLSSTTVQTLASGTAPYGAVHEMQRQIEDLTAQVKKNSSLEKQIQMLNDKFDKLSSDSDLEHIVPESTEEKDENVYLTPNMTSSYLERIGDALNVKRSNSNKKQ
jgi:hypothetical protein